METLTLKRDGILPSSYRCRHCGGNLEVGENEYHERFVKCTLCSREIPPDIAPEAKSQGKLPPGWGHMNYAQRHDWIDEHRAALEADIAVHGVEKTARLWWLGESTLRTNVNRWRDEQPLPAAGRQIRRKECTN